MRKFDHLVTVVRQRTRNTDYTSTSGIPQSLFVELGNEAQEHLQTSISNINSQLFIESASVSIVANQEAYEVPDRVLLGGKIIKVDYSYSGYDIDLYPLRRMNALDRRAYTGTPSGYLVQNSKILLNHIPNSSSGKIRISYIRQLDGLDVERGTVNGTPSGTTLATTGMDITSSPVNATNATYLCVSDKHGTVLLRNAEIASWSSPNFTLAANVNTYLVGSATLASLAGGSITFGKYSTTYSKLPDACERYLLLYMQKRILTLDESQTSIEEDAELKFVEAEIIKSLSDEVRDPQEFPVLDVELMW